MPIPKTRTCNKCKKEKHRSHFEMIIHRRTYDVGSDEDGYDHYLKYTKLCRACRDIARDRISQLKDGKLVVEFQI